MIKQIKQRKLLLITMLGIAVFTLAAAFINNKFSANSQVGKNIYVSPSEKINYVVVDSDPIKPVKKINDVVANLNPGDTLIFNDGTYNLNKPLYINKSGTQESPIVIKAQNKQQATLFFSDETSILNKVLIEASWVNFESFKVTQSNKAPRLESRVDGVNTSDILVRVRTPNTGINDRSQWITNVVIKDNYAEKAAEECFKANHAKNIEISYNSCYDTDHDGIDFVAVDSSVIKNNTIVDTGRLAILAKGGSRSIQIFNNYIRARTKNMTTGGIYLGGGTGFSSMAPVEPGSDYFEITHSAAWNNIMSAAPGYEINNGLALVGAKDSAFYNNIVRNTSVALFAKEGGDTKSWDEAKIDKPTTENGQYKNNIIIATNSAKKLIGSIESDFNLFYGINDQQSLGDEKNSIINTNPLLNGLRLKPTSPAIDKGATVSFTGFFGETFPVNRDYKENIRTLPWDMGLYNEVE